MAIIFVDQWNEPLFSPMPSFGNQKKTLFLPSKSKIFSCTPDEMFLMYSHKSSYVRTVRPFGNILLNVRGKTQHGQIIQGLLYLMASSMMASVASSGCMPTTAIQSRSI
mmetsp:Transcript_25601/g.74068  ORF Transcript_25601/g.74068 Transcript_25601/m.74068 type:complete len:109 (-) Transcript_25601:728-1054(-)